MRQIIEEHGRFADKLRADGPFAEGREQIGGIYIIEA